MTELIILAGMLMVGGTFYLAWRQQQNTKDLLPWIAQELGLAMANTRTGNALFQYGGVTGLYQNLPVFIGTAAKRTRGNDHFFLQVIVGRHPGITLGPAPVGENIAKSVRFKDAVQMVQDGVEVSARKDAKTPWYDGGQELEVYDHIIVRTFTVNGVQSQRWARRMVGSVKLMVAYAHRTA